MKVARIHHHGESNVIQIDDIPEPKPNREEVQIRLKSAALNHLDIWVRKGLPGISLPMILGSDGAGHISGVGRNCKKFKEGDEVILQPLDFCGTCKNCKAGEENYCEKMGIRGESLHGTNCEIIVLNERFVEPKPDGISFAEAAAFPLVGQTAYQMLVKRAQIKKGDVVLVWGANSGVGHVAVQIAKAFQCRVIATAGTTEKCAFAKKLGADLVLNHYEENIASKIQEYSGTVDVVFEHVGASTWGTSMKVLNRGGRVVTCGATTGPKVTIDLRYIFFKQQSILGSTMGNADSFRQIIQLVNDSKIIPKVDKSFPLEEISQAHEYLENSSQCGKVVLEI